MLHQMRLFITNLFISIFAVSRNRQSRLITSLCLATIIFTFGGNIPAQSSNDDSVSKGKTGRDSVTAVDDYSVPAEVKYEAPGVLETVYKTVFGETERPQSLVTIPVDSVAVTSTVPTASDNDYTRINNAIQAANSGDTIMLNGTFDWTEANAAASWALGSDGTASTVDDYSIYVPAGKSGVVLTASSLGTATIQGPGDLASVNLEGVLLFDGGGAAGDDNQNWTISNIRFVDFDLSIAMFNSSAGTDAFNGTIITNNYIRIAKDLNATAAPSDPNQNIGIHYSFGTNQTISNNTIEIQGDGVSDSANLLFASDVGMQSNTSGGAVYNGLQITGNIVRVLNAQFTANPQVVIGIWENAHGHSSNINVSNNQFINMSNSNVATGNLQRGFRVTSHSSASTTVEYLNNSVEGANIGFQWLSSNPGTLPVKLTSNRIANNAKGVLLNTNGSADFKYNRIVGNSMSGIDNATIPGGLISAEDNWWGCNAGPGNSAGCTGTTNGVSGAVTASTWLVLKAAAVPTSTKFGGTPSTITADLTFNSANNQVMGNVPDTTPVAFATTTPLLGTVSPTSSTLTSGLATSTFTAANSAGVASVSSTVDGQTISNNINVDPVVTSIKRKTPLTQYTTASSVVFEVIFNAPVKNVDDTDFVVTTLNGGIIGATANFPTSATPFTTYSVVVNGYSGEGEIRLDLVDDNSIDTRVTNLPLGGAGAGNGNFNTGETYIIDINPPTVTIKQNPSQPDSTNASPIIFDVVFSEDVGTSFTTGDVTLSGTAGATTATVTGSGANYTVSVTGMTVSGTVIVNIPAMVAQDLSGKDNTASTTGLTINDDNVVNYFVGGIVLAVDDDGMASAASCGDLTPTYSTIQSAVAASGTGYTIKVCSGLYPLASTVNVPLANLTIIAAEATKPLIQVGGTMDGFNVTATGVTIENLDIEKVGLGIQHHMIRVQANNFTGRGNYLHGPAWQTLNDPSIGNRVSRAFVMNAGITGWLVDGNVIENFRNVNYTTGGSGIASNNTWTGTKGWVNDESEIYFDNNTMTTCADCDTDIALLVDENTGDTPNYIPYYSTSPNTPLEVSQRNNNAHIDVQFTIGVNDSGRAVSYVNAGMGSSTNDGRVATPYASIQQAIFDPTGGIVDGTLPGGTVNVAAGTYNEDVTVDRTLKIVGAGAATTTVSGPIGGGGSTFQLAASNIDLSGFTITRAGNNPTDWNNPGLNTAGIAIQGLTLTGNVIHDNTITGMRTGIDVNSSNGHTVRNNVIDTNRTGLIFRNQTDDSVVVENTITNNFTVGILFLDASVGSNVPVQTALNSAFINNNLSGNWYGQIVDRQTGGSLPAPGGSPKNFQGNWFGTTTPVVTTANSTEPSYAAQIPVIFGGTATAPGGQPDIAGPASANFRYTQVLTSGTDTNVETTTGRGTNGFQGSPIFTNSESPTGWFFFTETPVASGGYAIGPATPPLGQGSARFTVDATGGQSFGTTNYGGIRFDRITKLGYSSYQQSGNAAAAVALQFDVDSDLSDGNTSFQGRLVYEPSNDPSNTVLQNTWQSWDALSPTAKFWGSGSGPSRPFSNACPISAPCTKAQILALFPNIGIRSSAANGVLLFKAGGGVGASFNGYVDKFDLGISTGNTTFDFEPGRPTVTINQAMAQLDPTNASTINFTAVFSTAVTGFTGAGVTLSGTAGATTAVVTEIAPMDGTTYNVAVSGMGMNGTVIAAIVDSAATANPPSNGGPSLPSTSTDNTVTYDTTAPTAVLTYLGVDPTNSTLNFSVAFSEVVSGLLESEISVTNGTVVPASLVCSGNPTTCTFSVTAGSDGTVTVQVPADTAQDTAGNNNTASNSISVTFDASAPTVTVEGVTDPDTTSPVDFTVTFSEAVTDFDDASDVVVTGSAFTTGTPIVVITGGATVYNIAVSGMNQTGNVVVSIPANSAIDAASNGNTASTAGTPNGNDVQFNLPNTNVLVTPADPMTWAFFQETAGVASGSLVTGPATPPLGTGSARLTVDTAAGMAFGRAGYSGTKLSDITNLSYSSYQTSGAPSVAIAFQFDVDSNLSDGDTGYQGRLVYEPSNDPSNTVNSGAWQTWDALSPTAKFWGSGSGASRPFSQACPQTAPCTKQFILQNFPDIGVRNGPGGTSGVILFKVGAGVNPAFDGNIDNLVLGVNSVNTTFNFEETPPTVSISDATAVTESDSGTTTANFTVSLDVISTLPTTVQVSTANGSATTADNDYVAAVNQVVTIPAGMTSAPFTVSVNGDNIVETDETFTVNLSNAANAAIGDGQGTGTITNDDAFGTLQFSSTTYSVTEGTPTASITITRTGGNDQAVSVDCSTVAGGSATGGGVDYTTVTNQTISFGDQDSANKTCSIPITNDMIFEVAETVNLSLSNAVGATLGSPSSAILTINDSGNFILISGNIQQYNAPSPNTNLAGVTVTLTGSASATTVTDSNGNYTFNGGLPTGPNNYLVTPSLAGKVFDPTNRSYVNLMSNVTNANFVAYNTGAIPRNIRIVNTSQATYTSNITVPIVIDSLGTENAMSFSLNFNPSLLTFSSAACGSDAPGCTFTTNNTMSGLLGVEFERADDGLGNPTTFTAGNGRQVILITFTANPGVVFNTPVTFGDTPATRDVNDTSGNSLPTNYVNGSVIFAQGIEGDVAGRPTGSNTLSGADVSVLRQFVAGTATDPNFNEFQRADVAPAGSKGGGTITSADVTVLRNYLANSIFTPVGGPTQPIAPLTPFNEIVKADKGEKAVAAGDVRIVSVSSSAGSSVSVPITLDSGGNENGVTLSVQFDQTKLNYTGAAFGVDVAGMPGTTFDVNLTQLASGRVGISFTLDVNQTFTPGLKRILIVNFNVPAGAPTGFTPITFVNQPLPLELNDPLGNVLPSNFAGGNVNITGPTSANASVGGRLVDTNGSGIGRTTVTLSDGNGVTRSAVTNSFGNYSFDNVVVGGTYTISVSNGRRYVFSPSTRVITVNESVSNLDFTAENQ